MLRLLRDEKESGLDPDLSQFLLDVTRKMTMNSCPSSFFNFDGVECGLQADEFYFPTAGYTFSSWIRIERTTQNGNYRFFSLFDAKGNGLEFYFKGNHAVVQVNSGRKSTRVVLNHFFHTNRWYYVSFTQNKKFIATSELQFFVDGELKEKADLRYPPLASCVSFNHFGTNIPHHGSTVSVFSFCGQCGPIVFFDKPLAHYEISTIYKCGPDFQYNFKKSEAQPQYFDLSPYESLGTKIALLYNPRACTKDRFVIDNAVNKRTAQSNARILNGTTVFIARNVRDTLNCIGGVEVIFPLLKLLKDDWTIKYNMCASIISLLSEMLRYSRTNQEVMIQNSGFCTLGFILSELDPRHINLNTLKSLQGMLECAFFPKDPILKDIYHDIFTNFELWIKVDFSVHENMLIFLKEEVSRNPDYFHEIFGIQYFLDNLRYYFWYKPEKDSVATYNASNRPSDVQLHTLRLHLTEIMKLMLVGGVKKEELQAIALFCIDCQDAQQVVEILKWMLVLLDEEVSGLINEVSDEKFYVPFFSMLKHEQKTVRIFALKVLGKIIEKTTNDRKYKFETNGGYLIMEHSFLDEQYFTNETFTALFEILLDRVSYKVSAGLTVDVSNEQVKICRPALLHPFFQLISEQHVKYKERALRTFNVLLKSNADNRLVFAEQFGWQNWLLQLMVPQGNPTEDEEKLMKTVTTLTIDTLIVVLSEQLLVKNGWKVVRDTLQFISVVAERKEIDADMLNIDLFNQLLPVVVNYINKIEADKEKEFWRNLFHIIRIVEETILVKALNNKYDESEDYHQKQIFERQIQVIKYIVLGFDYLIKMSLKEYKVMEILHYTGFGRSTKFGFQTIINLASDLTANKGYIPERTLFSILFRMQLFLLKHLDEKTIVSEVHFIRTMALLCQDIDHTRVPKLIFKNEVTDADTTNRRSYYILASLIHRILTYQQYNLVPIAQAVVRKKKSHFATTLIDPRAKDFMSKELTGIEQESDTEEFILSLKDEWDCVKESEPMATALQEVAAEISNMYKKAVAEATARQTKIIQRIEKKSSSDIPILKKVVEDSAQSKSLLCYSELQRLNNWRHYKRRLGVITLNEWTKVEEDLFSGGGVWAKQSEKKMIFQKLDSTENKHRMRMRLVVDPNGTNHPEAVSKKSQFDDNPSDLLSRTSELASSFVRQPKTENQEEIIEEEDDFDDEDFGAVIEEQIIKEEDWESISKKEEEAAEKTGLQKESEERTVLIAPCEMVLPLDIVKGNLEITNSYIYFIVTHDDNEPVTNTKKEQNETQYNKKWHIDHISELYKRRYLLRHTAMEIFFLNKTNYFFNFENGELNSVISAIIAQSPMNMKLHAYNSTPSVLLKKTKLTQKWQRREISNFDYLMALNTLANRTYNDLTQYPVFPWVIRDYESQTINLNNPSVYRDLSRPIGALMDSKLKQLDDRYKSFIDPNIPPFHFGSHYSSVGTVLFYLLRMEPFTELGIKLQGGSFDLADRLFHSIPSTWNNIMKAPSDCKELTPEFFYCPEFLRNLNKLNLGQKQNREYLGDAVLPPWASSPEEFIRINREALESDYVSENLHHWIDLIFGYKQTGEEARKAYNVYYYLTYEGSVDLDKVDDPLLKKSIETQISNFGQTPTKLFNKPHPQRAVRTRQVAPLYWRDNSFIPFYSTPVFETDMDRGKPALFVHTFPDMKMNNIYVVNANRQLFIFNWMKPRANTVFSTKIGSALATDIVPSNKLYSCTKDGKWLFSCGHFDKSIKCSNISDKLQVKQTVYHHKDIVTCMATSEDGLFLVSGSIDATVNVYSVVHVELDQRPGHRIRKAGKTVGSVIGNARKSRRLSINSIDASANSTGSSLTGISSETGTVSSLTTSNTQPLSSQPLQILYGHEVEITCVDVNSDIDTVVSGDANGHVILHTLLGGTYVRTISFNHPIDFVKISSEGHIVIHTSRQRMLYVFNLNGCMLSKMDVGDKLRACAITQDAKYVVTGGMNKTIVIRQLYDLRELHAFEPLSNDIQCITFCKQDKVNNILATTTDGMLYYLPVDQSILEREIVLLEE